MGLGNLSIQRRIRQNDLEEFENLFKTYYSPLCHFACKFTRDMDVAEEIVQEFFYNYWKNREELDIKISLKSYLFRSIRNNSIKYLEHLAVRNRYAQSVKDTTPEAESYYSNTTIEVKELNEVIENTLKALPERCQQIFRLNRFEGLKYQEIADKLSISIKTVEANMGKALQLFRRNLKHYDEYAV